ncbi:hypothetical protein Cgig2_007757 [Carnegiea gigantea]|uniref:Endonuclease/exonuclease/phosphatase domain-containing protein n=1 Tax=Carnegiea gigantea TaxID=171969 RepID=A0A9Q1QE92_9CARY|nr:hypothetical protein Cgig2_007757 [Carnegiea gigantea]
MIPMNYNMSSTNSSRQEASNAHACTIMVWNVQGAGSSEFLKVLKEHIRMQRPNVVALVETHILGPTAQAICEQIGFNGCYRVEAQGFQDGIWVLRQSDDLDISITHAHAQYRGILETKELVQKGLRFSIGDGLRTKFWIDKWVDGTTLLTHAIRAVPDDHRPFPIRSYWLPGAG